MCLNAALFCHFRPCRRDSYKSPFLIAICLHICQAKPIITMTHDWFHKTMHVLKQHGMRASLSSFLVEPHRELFCIFKEIRGTLWRLYLNYGGKTHCAPLAKKFCISTIQTFTKEPPENVWQVAENHSSTLTRQRQTRINCSSAAKVALFTGSPLEFHMNSMFYSASRELL